MKKSMLVFAGALLLQVSAYAGQEGFGTPPPQTKPYLSTQTLFCRSDIKTPQVQNTIVPVGTKVLVVASANPSTGYSWVTKQNLEIVDFIPSEPMAVGSGGEAVYELPLKEGINSFKFEYKRAWEKVQPAASTCILTVTVK